MVMRTPLRSGFPCSWGETGQVHPGLDLWSRTRHRRIRWCRIKQRVLDPQARPPWRAHLNSSFSSQEGVAVPRNGPRWALVGVGHEDAAAGSLAGAEVAVAIADVAA